MQSEVRRELPHSRRRQRPQMQIERRRNEAHKPLHIDGIDDSDDQDMNNLGRMDSALSPLPPDDTPANMMSPMQEKSNEKSLMTTYEGSNGSLGAMFDVKVKLSSTVQLNGMDIHVSDAVPDCAVEVYGRRGTHVGHETNPDAWELLVDDTVDCRGYMRRTKIPADKFKKELRLGPDEVMSFFVYLPQVGMNNTVRYTNGDELGGVFSEDDHLSIFQGSGLGGFFEKVYQPRIWNGMVHYTLDKQIDECEELSFGSPSFGDVAAYGNMFDLRTAEQSITITGMDIHADPRIANTYVTYNIYTKRDTFRLHGQSGLDAWYRVATGTVLVLEDDDFALTVTPTSFVPIGVPAGTIQGFYVTLSTPHMMSRFTSLPANQIYDSNGDMELRVGVGVDTHLPSASSYFGPTEWSGTIRYVRGNNVDKFLSGGLCNEVEATLSAPSLTPTTARPSSLPSAYPTAAPSSVPTSLPSLQPTTAAPTTEPVVLTTVTYVMYVQHSQAWPSDVVMDSVASDVRATIESMLEMDRKLEILSDDFGLRLNDVTSSLGSDEKVGYSCQATTYSSCTLIEAHIHLAHNPRLEPGRVSYDFLRFADEVTERVGLGTDLTASYVGDEPVSTKTILTLDNVPERIMGQQESQQFQQVVASFLNDALAEMEDFMNTPGGAPQILGVVVDSQDIKHSDTSPPSRARTSLRTWDWMVSSFGGDNGDQNEGTRLLQSTSSSIDIATTITGHYRPPPEINFPSLVEDSIDTGSPRLTRDLATSVSGENGEASGGYFEAISGVTSRQINPIVPLKLDTPAPSPSPLEGRAAPSNEESPNHFLIIFSVLGAFILLAATMLFFTHRRRRNSIQSDNHEENNEKKPNRFSFTAKTESVWSQSSRSLHMNNFGMHDSYKDDELGMPQPTFKYDETDQEGHRNGNRTEALTKSRDGLLSFGNLGRCAAESSKSLRSNLSSRSLDAERKKSGRMQLEETDALDRRAAERKREMLRKAMSERLVRENMYRMERSHSFGDSRSMQGSYAFGDTAHGNNEMPESLHAQNLPIQGQTMLLVSDDDTTSSVSIISPMGLMMQEMKKNKPRQNTPANVDVEINEKLTSTRSSIPSRNSSFGKLTEIPLSEQNASFYEKEPCGDIA